ncbi:hypothetical protein [Actinokineospora sp. HUAS TT18]|uniref:hypothetical protein n=1 Tax=Actinokineospora sp. HUAS TT18 TaxID=3447451 RepID=UPI003F520FDF
MTNPNDNPTVEALSEQLDALRREHTEFRGLVRDRAIKGVRDGEWTGEALNETLERLGLPRSQPEHVTVGRVSLHFDLEIGRPGGQTEFALRRHVEDHRVVDGIRAALAAAFREHPLDGMAMGVGDVSSQVNYVDARTVWA